MRIRLNKFFKLSVLLITWPFFSAKAQSLDEIKKLFPQEHAVMLNRSLHYKISIRNGQPYVESNETEQIQYLNSQAPSYMSKYGFFQSDFQQVIAYEAYTRTRDDKKLKVNEFKTSTSKEDFVFYDDVKETTFDFPSISEGAIGNLNVSWVNKDAHLLSPYFFESHIPVINSELVISFPKDMTIKYQLFGQDTSKVTFSVEKNRHEFIYTFRYKNSPSQKTYGDAPGAAWYATHLIFYIEKFTDEKGNSIPYLSGTDALYHFNYDYLKDINHSLGPELKFIVDSLTDKSSSDEQKARKIYAWVQGQIKYVAYEEGMEGFIPRDANLVCHRRFGDCKDMSSILTVMMRAAGLKAYYTWIGTRNLPYRFSTLPLPMVSNHMICTILLNGKYIFLDGTDPTCIFGFPSYAIQDKEAMIAINENEYKILIVPVVDKSENRIVDSAWLELTDTRIKGRIRKTLTGYYSMKLHAKLLYLNKSDLRNEIKEELGRGTNKFQLDTFSISNSSDPDLLVIDAIFDLPDYAKKLGSEWYVNLNLFKFYDDEEIDIPNRRMPIEYNFKSERKYITLLKIPSGYKVEYLPKSDSYHNEVWGFDITYKQNNEWIVLGQHFENDHLFIYPDQFVLWNKVLEKLFPLYKESLVISKNNTQ